LGKFGLRHGWSYQDGWTVGLERWLNALSFAEPARAVTWAACRAAVAPRDAELGT
jgi:hypothetical protein